jgi:L-amino acid N-acyltransferase
MNVQIRPFQIDDAQTILDIINYNILHSTSLYDYTPRNLEQQVTILNEKLKKGFPVIVAISNGVLVGFAYYSEFRFREAYKYTVEHSVYVHPDHTAKGIGKLLLTELIAIAIENNLHTMIGVIDSENTNSIAFHETFGFTNQGVLKETGFKFDRWLHSVLMQKML